MIRKAFRMSVNPDQQAEYARRHSPIWPELEAVLRSHGVQSYSIFLDPSDSSLFAYLEIEDAARWSAIADTPECRRWWRHMREIMPSNPDYSPVSIELQPVFQLNQREPIDPRIS